MSVSIILTITLILVLVLVSFFLKDQDNFTDCTFHATSIPQECQRKSGIQTTCKPAPYNPKDWENKTFEWSSCNKITEFAAKHNDPSLLLCRYRG
jgi:hypothetical protein